MDPKKESLESLDDVEKKHKSIVTTTRVTHASPAGAYAHVANCHWENDAEVLANPADPNMCPDIAYQLVHSHPGKNFKVILGGVRCEFTTRSTIDEEGYTGQRTTARNLIEEWKADKAERQASYQYVWNRDQLLAANASLPDYLLGLFESSHMQYNMKANPATEPTLADLTEVAIRMLSRNENGFFLFVEGGRIDHGHHDNYVELSLDETIKMSEAVAKATELLSEEDSLIVVTTRSPRGTDILGTSNDRDHHNVPYQTLSYTNGPGYRLQVGGQRTDISQEANYRGLTWRAHVDVPLESETHGGDDVAVFAWGSLFGGLYEQNHIPHRMAYAACLGPGLHACNTAAIARPIMLVLAPLAYVLYVML